MGTRASHWLWLATIGFACFVSIHIASTTYVTDEELKTGSFFEKFLSLPPNAIGDTLAGIFGSLAFLAAVTAVVLQTKELAAQREELRLTRAEMKEQRQAMQDMARAMASQAEIFEDEKLARDQARVKDLLWEQLRGLSDQIDECSRTLDGWEIADGSTGSDFVFVSNSFLHLFPPAEELSKDDHIKKTYHHLVHTRQQLEKNNAIIEHKPVFSSNLDAIQDKLKAITSTANSASLDQKEFVRNLKVGEISRELNTIASNQSLWNETD